MSLLRELHRPLSYLFYLVFFVSGCFNVKAIDELMMRNAHELLSYIKGMK